MLIFVKSGENMLESILKNTSEIVSIEELTELLKKEEKIAYIGFEPSGRIHMGHYLQIRKMIDLQKAGFKILILLADLHAYLNQKGTMEEVRALGEENRKVFEAMGLVADYVYGSEFQLKQGCVCILELCIPC